MIFLFFILQSAFALAPSDSIQLQQLIAKSQQQIDSLQAIVTYKKRDVAALEQAVQLLTSLTAGVEKSIAKYQGTKAYENALLELQAKDDFSGTYSDMQNVRDQSIKETHQNGSSKQLDDIKRFQKESVRANQTDMASQKDLQEALNSAPLGFIPKIQTQAEIGGWQASTRISAQLTELLSAVQAMREELRAQHARQAGPDLLSTLIEGAANPTERGGKADDSR